MRYTAYFVGALQSELGTDLGFRQSPGLIDTGMFRIQSAGPAGETFNFADAGSRIARAPEMFFFARAFDRPVYAAHERLLRGERIDPFHLYWFNPDGAAGDISALPTATMFKRINVVFFRSAWSDPKAAFVGFKGGDNTASHAHADLGTFVYDVDGVRWALDLGADDYNLPAYFGEKRYTYYRLRTEGHNTLTIGNENQNIRGGVAPLVAFSPRAGEAFAVADLTAGYAPKVIRAQRGIQLLGRQLLVQDEVEAQEPIDLVWNFHTDSDVVTTHSAAATGMLNHGKHQLNMKILQGDGAAFKVESANPPPPQAQQPKVKNLTIRQPHKTSTLRLAVLFWPQDETPAEVNVRPLAEWIAAAPIAR
jgi:hypothetical protein